ncbi:MAG: bifunctional folylpolyglutamate synthase/dihydrofolate synthase, partial [Hyphomicrobium denitrificans]|nr:bifunctional folylpolyglutamate synthase/dihydrofolate synthase [Hyphomicrobium denitrificans]
MTSSKTRPSSDVLLGDLMLLHPKLIDLSLGRVERLLAKLGHPEKKLPPVVHIAGTNGKGSITAYLRSFMEAAGKRVHVYTSPHLVRFHERIVLAGPDGTARAIDEDSLVDVLMRVQAVNDGEDITQFEITTAAAFLAFSETPADILLLEVGLGGRPDATNVISDPALTIITPISMDHAEKLGPTITKIALEKAGILKSGVEGV